MNKIPWKQDELLDWIRTSGFPLEYQLAQIIKSNGFEPILDLHIECPEEGIVREIDVCFDVYDKSTRHKTRFLIECKYTKNPWIALCGFPQPFGAFELDGFCRTKTAGYFWDTTEGFNESEKYLMDNDYFGPTLISCNSLHEPSKSKNDRKDLPYATLKKIILSAQDFVTRVDQTSQDMDFTCVPCIVIANDLFQADWVSEINDFKIKPVNFARMSWMGTGSRRSALISTTQNSVAFCSALINMGNCINAIHKSNQ